MEKNSKLSTMIDKRKIENQVKTIQLLLDSYDSDEIIEINGYDIIALVLCNNGQNVDLKDNVLESFFENLLDSMDDYNQIDIKTAELQTIFDVLSHNSVRSDYLEYLLGKYLINEKIIENEYRISSPFENLNEEKKEELSNDNIKYHELIKVNIKEYRDDLEYKKIIDEVLYNNYIEKQKSCEDIENLYIEDEKYWDLIDNNDLNYKETSIGKKRL